MGFVAGRDFLKKVPFPHPSPKTLGRGRKIIVLKLLLRMRFFNLYTTTTNKVRP